MRYDKVLFVCRDNTNLSMMAESIFVHYYTGRQLYVASRGLVVLMPTPCNPKTEIVLNNHGIRMVSGTSKPLKEEEFTDSTIAITFSGVDKERFHGRYPYVAVQTLTEFIGETLPVPNPYGGTLEDYEQCYREMERMIRKAAKLLAETQTDEGKLDNMFERN